MKVGDVVQLKSGGPAMTVEGERDGQTWCKWFDGPTVQEGAFKTDALKPYEPPPKKKLSVGVL